MTVTTAHPAASFPNSDVDWLAVMHASYAWTRDTLECPPDSHLEFLGEHIFDFTTYQSDMAELFGLKALEVAEAITDATTYAYHGASEENLRWYLIMCNMPFFALRIEWGTSIRGAWWDYAGIESIDTCSLVLGGRQIKSITFDTTEEWLDFIHAVIAFGRTPTPTTETPA